MPRADNVSVKSRLPYGLKLKQWNMSKDKRYRALMLLGDKELGLKEWTLLALNSGLYKHRKGTELVWATKAGLSLANLGLVKRNVYMVSCGSWKRPAVKYAVTDLGRQWLREYRKNMLGEDE